MPEHWFRHILTGADNQTVAIGRILGIVVFAIFVAILPAVAIVTVARGLIAHDQWATIFDKLTVYVPSILLSIAGLIGLTGPSEPKEGR